MAEVQTASRQEAGLSLKAEWGDEMKKKTEFKPYNSQNSSTGSTRSTASTELASSDSDTASSVSRKVKQAAKHLAKSALGEPMKVEVGGSKSYPNTNHPQIENILNLQKLQTDLESSLHTIVKQELLAAAAADAVAWQQQQMWQQQQPQMMWEYDPYTSMSGSGCPPGVLGVPADQMGYQDSSPLVPYLLAELANGSAVLPPPRPGFDPARKWAPDQQGLPPRTPLNPESKAFKPNTKTDKVNKAASKATAAPTEVDDKVKEMLNEARNADHARTVVATKINRLGFSAEKMLKEHFAQFGKIDHVCVPHKIKRVQGTASTPGHSHLRPSGLGFVVMDTEEEAQAILAAGAEQLVCGKLINVRGFKQGQNVNSEDAAQED